MAARLVDAAAIEAEIDRIRSLGLDALRNRWRKTLASPPPAAFGKDLLVRFLCWHLQEQAFGELDPGTAKLLDGLARGGRTKPDRRLKPGTVLVREYRGMRHTVTVVPTGYVWREIQLRKPLGRRARHHGHGVERTPLLWTRSRSQSSDTPRGQGE